MSRENPTWGAPRILSELLLLGHDVAESTVGKYMIRQPKPSSQTWRTFLKNRATNIVACVFFTVPTFTFRLLYVFLVLRHDLRRLIHFNVTTNPTSQWTAQQLIEAFPFDGAPRFLLRDRDSIYGEYFRDRAENMGHRRSRHCVPLTLAKRLRRTRDQFHPPGMLGSLDCLEQKSPAMNPG